ncbi:type I-E CRISPR-associated protein Cse1/CasA [Citrobacter braakii]|uniref:type I-E CRISPR-associated protein Cse1/CasA n=1 Tax=Citrobacter braakii TaxID=57706 RepID=UPI0030762B37
MFSLITEPWLPVIDRQGQRRKISPRELADNDIIELAWPRADFQGAAYQLLIGLLQTVFAPEDEEQWGDIWEDGIDPDRWQKALERVAVAMQFGPQKPAFLQEFSRLDVENSAIAGLLIDAASGNAVELNKDHFVKRRIYRHFCPHCAVMALYTVQTNSPAGGPGFRTSMRGGGPLTTLLMPVQPNEPLWRKLWLNVMPGQQQWQDEQLALIFPWLAATRSSETEKNRVTPENAHPLQAYWGMPRRLEIDFSHTQSGECDLCGEHHPALLSQIRSKNYGVQYDGWVHPLSPYRKALKDAASPMLALKGQPGGLVYKDWLGLTMTTEDKLNCTIPARVVLGNPEPGATGLWCFGFDMDNAKARCWYEHRLPLIALSADEAESFKGLLSIAVELAISVRPLLVQALKQAWFGSPKEAKGDFSIVDIAFWQQTEPGFRQLWQTLSQHPSSLQPQARAALREWGENLQRGLLQIFDQSAFTNPDNTADLQRILSARLSLIKNVKKLTSLKTLKELAMEHKEQANV